jgi:hypothetical protein
MEIGMRLHGLWPVGRHNLFAVLRVDKVEQGRIISIAITAATAYITAFDIRKFKQPTP